MVALFRAFFVALADSTDRQSLKIELEAVTQQLQLFTERSPEYRDYLYLLWLQEEIAGKLTASMR
ncbi:MAG: hypothetical protein UZ07_CHB004002568 [Chlorobi bacterium OLB7]|nr:MAG: hypothetical protein UZ07_CHB004002568 [Chlorobi bacterium OLB7]